jgi:hypothetical protein
MSLDDLDSDVTDAAGDLGEELSVSLDRETRTELAMLAAAFEPDGADELLRRGVHNLFQMAVETGQLDFHLRNKYDVTYDEMTGGSVDTGIGNDPDDRRYQF